MESVEEFKEEFRGEGGFLGVMLKLRSLERKYASIEDHIAMNVAAEQLLEEWRTERKAKEESRKLNRDRRPSLGREDGRKTGYVVYFILDEHGNCKIGNTSGSTGDLVVDVVAKRLAALQTANASYLTVAGVTLVHSEESMHERFWNLRVRGEWFEYAGDLKRFVETSTVKLRMPRRRRCKLGAI